MRARLPARFARFFAPLLLLTACDTGPHPTTLEIVGDTLIYAALFTLPDGQQNANCGYRVTARATGDRGDTAIIRQGRVKYSFAETGQEHMTWEWTPETLATIWDDPRIATGDTARSKHHDLSFSMPFNPIRGEVVFNYTVVGDDSVRTTTPFIFDCR